MLSKTKIFEIIVKSGESEALMLIEARSMKEAVKIAKSRISKNDVKWDKKPNSSIPPKISRIDIQGDDYEF